MLAEASNSRRLFKTGDCSVQSPANPARAFRDNPSIKVFWVPIPGTNKNPAVRDPAMAPKVLREYAHPTRRPAFNPLGFNPLITSGNIAPRKSVGRIIKPKDRKN